MQVIKRDGTSVPYDSNKIYNAVTAAFKSTGEKYNKPQFESFVDTIPTEVQRVWGEIVSVETIQNIIETWLMVNDYYATAKAYILYREEHKKARIMSERLDYMRKYEKSSSSATDLSNTDSNANSNLKNVTSEEAEIYKDLNRLIQRHRVKELFKTTNSVYKDNYIEDLEHHIIYQHDEASSPVLKPYCSAYTLYPLLIDGTNGIDGCKNKPPKNLDSFCGQFNNLVFLLSAQKKGAGAYAELWNFFSYFCEKEWGKDYFKREHEVVTTDSCLNKKTIGNVIDQHFQQITYYINQPAQNRGWSSPFTNFNIFDKYYWKAMFEDFVFPDGSVLNWDAVNWLQKRYMVWLNNERTKTLLTFPVMTVLLLTDGKDVKDKEYKDFVTDQWAKGDSFFVYLSDNADSVSSCCRLRNEVTDNCFSSTTGLTGIQTGSCNVMTLNLNRIVQDWYRSIDEPEPFSWDTYKDSLFSYVKNILDRVYDYQIAYKTGLYELDKNGMLPATKAGYISLDKLYCTIGVNGLNEAARFLGFSVDNNPKYMSFVSELLATIKEYNKANSSNKFKFNLELVPAESLGVKNYNWDKEDNYWVPEDKNLYNSYIYDAHNNTSILDKIAMQGGDVAKSVNGGQASHLNLEENLSKEQYTKLLEYAVEVGNNYITFNVPQTQCDKCGFIAKHPFKECPKCGSTDVTYWTRIIGYLRPTKTWGSERQHEGKQRNFVKPDEVC